MTDDIVTRLRAKGNRVRFVVGVNEYIVVEPSLEEAAADEIERLRAEVLKLGRAYGKAVDYIGRIGDE